MATAAPPLIPPPGANEPFVMPDGSINPAWLTWLTRMFKVLQVVRTRGLLDLADVDNSTPITNGQVLVFDGTDQKFKPGAN